jgi:hypothetical protein
MSGKPRALYLSEQLDAAAFRAVGCLESLSAKELRRLHAENERLTADNERLKGLLRDIRLLGHAVAFHSDIDEALQEPPR